MAAAAATRRLLDHRLSSTFSPLLLLGSVLFALCCCQLSVVSAKYHHQYPQYHHQQQNALQRGYRAVADNGPSNECRYDKGPWQECDALTGKQKRVLTMRSAAAGGGSAPVNSDCPSEKFIERPCKKQCKYSKGVWSECTNGAKERIDKLKTEVSTSGCKPEKAISKQCKKQCAYEKSEWSPCEGGIKTKTLTLVEGGGGGSGQTAPNSVDCEATKTITKACPGKHGGQAAATNKQQQKRFRKQQQQQLKNREQVS